MHRHIGGRSLATAAAVLLAACGEGAGRGGRCEILSERVVRLGGEGEEGSFLGWPRVSPLVGEGYYLGNALWTASREPPMVFDRRGRYLRALGPKGGGPGEYRHPEHFLRYLGDSVLVLDRDGGRAVVLDAQLGVGRSLPFVSMASGVVVLDDGSLVLAESNFSTTRPIQVFAPDGIRRTDFGLNAPPTRTTFAIRQIARSGPRTIWAIHSYGDYEFEEWDVEGNRLRTLRPEREWFPPSRPRVAATPTQPGSPLPLGMFQGTEGHLWAVLMVSDPEWHEGLGPMVRSVEGEYYPTIDHRKAWDGLVDVIDTTTGASIASRRFDLPIIQVVEPGLVALGRETIDGWWTVELTRLRLSPGCVSPRKD